MKKPNHTLYRKAAAFLGVLALIRLAPSSLWEVRTAFGLLWIDLPSYSSWADLYAKDPHPVELHFAGIVLLGLVVIGLIAGGCLFLYQNRCIRAVAYFITAGVMAAVRYWDYKAFDLRYDFQHLLGHAVWNTCIGNPLPGTEVLPGGILISLVCVAVPFAFYGIAVGCWIIHSLWRRAQKAGNT